MGQFTIKIKLGNDAMQTAVDISTALRLLANKMENYDFSIGTVAGGVIMDTNGNKVGNWVLS